MGDLKERKYEIYDVDASFTESTSMIADYSVIEQEMEDGCHRESMNHPTLPSGRVIDCKNTMQSYDFPLDSSVATQTTSQTSNRGVTKAIICTTPGSYHQSEANRSAMSAGLTSASNNSNTEDVHAVAIVEGKLYTDDNNRPLQNRRLWWVGGLLAIAAAIVGTGVCASGKCSAKYNPTSASTKDETGTLSPTLSPTETPMDVLVERAVALFVNEISFLEDEIFVNGTNPESRALAWLIREDTLFNDSALLTLDSDVETEVSFRIRQRYPLITLWYQQVDEYGAFVKNWAKTLGWLEYEDECEWYGLECTLMDLGGNVGEQNVVTEIDFYIDLTESSMDFSGTIPPDICLLSSLTLLDFKANRVTGSLPESIGYCSLLEGLDLSECLVAGTLPSSIGKLTSMYYFDVSDNGFHGTLPPSAEQWPNVTYMRLLNNGFSGSLPDYLGKWTALVELDFYDNGFTGTIPDSIGLLTSLKSLNLGKNDLRGTLPSTIGEFVNMTFFIVSSNDLEGTIPASVGSWSKIQYAYFYDNPFTGTVPNQICSYIDVLTDEVVVDCQLNCTCCSYLENCTAMP